VCVTTVTTADLFALPEVLLPLLLPDSFLVDVDDLLGLGLSVQHWLGKVLLDHQLKYATAKLVHTYTRQGACTANFF
jgi:hypothetical protein